MTESLDFSNLAIDPRRRRREDELDFSAMAVQPQTSPDLSMEAPVQAPAMQPKPLGQADLSGGFLSRQDIPYVDPNAARMGAGMLAMGGGQAGWLAVLPEEILTVPLAGWVGGEAAKLINRLSGKSKPIESVGQALEEGLLETARDAAGGAVFKIGGKVIHAMGKAPNLLRGGRDAADMLEDYRNLEIPIPGNAGAITGNRATQSLESVLRKLPTSAALYQQADEATNIAFSRAGMRIAKSVGRPGEAVVVGRGIKGGLEGFADKVRAKGRVVFGAVKQAIGRDTPVAPQATAQHVDELLAPFTQTDGSLSPAARNLPPIVKDVAAELKAAPGGKLTWERMDALRKQVGEKLADPTLIEPNSKGQLKQMYKVLSADMEDVARSLGGQTLKKWQAARNYWSAAMDRVDLIRDVAANEKTEGAFKAAFSGSKDGPTLLRALRKSMPRDVWNDVVATKIAQMMEAPAGQQNALGNISSPAAFLTQWNNLRKGGNLNVLFGGNTKLRDSMNQLARVAESIKDTAKSGNYSNTGPFNYFANLLTDLPRTAAQVVVAGGVGAPGGVPGMVVSTGAGLLGPYAIAKAFLHEPFVKWLAIAPEAAKRGSQTMALHFARLAAIEANAPPETQEYIRVMRRDYENTVER